MAAITIHSDFKAPKEEICHYFPLFLFYLPCSNGDRCHDLSFLLIFSLKLTLLFSSYTLIKRLFSSSLLSAIRVVLSVYQRLIFLPEILIPACNSSSLAFVMICSAYKLNKQGDNKQPKREIILLFSILNQSAVPYRVLTFASWPAYRLLSWQIKMVLVFPFL